LPPSIWNLTARDRSFDSNATRRTALVRRSRSNSTRLSLLFGMTRSNAGNCPSIIREISRRPPISKKRGLSPRPHDTQRPPADLEKEVVLAAFILDVSVALGEKPSQFEQRLPGQDDANFL